MAAKRAPEGVDGGVRGVRRPWDDVIDAFEGQLAPFWKADEPQRRPGRAGPRRRHHVCDAHFWVGLLDAPGVSADCSRSAYRAGCARHGRAEKWVSQARFFCKYCKVYYADNKMVRVRSRPALRRRLRPP